MEETIQGALIDHDLRPAYYDKFRCLMGECQLNCCKDSWRIAFDRKDYLTLKHVKGSPELNSRLSHSLRRIRNEEASKMFFGEFDMHSGVCPLLREDGICLLQLEKGSQPQPFVCRSFPRHESATRFGFFERSLSLACEGVLELLWNIPEGISFSFDPLPQKEQQTFFLVKGCPFSVNQNQEIRSACIDLLQERRFSLPQRILLVGIVLKELCDGEKDINRWRSRVRLLCTAPDTPDLLYGFGDLEQMDIRMLVNNFRVILSLDPTSKLRSLQEEIESGLGIPVVKGSKISRAGSVDISPAYRAAQARFRECFKGREYFMENLMVAVFFQLCLPNMDNLDDLWKSYVNYCNIYSFFRFMAVMSCRRGAPGDKSELFRLLVEASRRLLHDSQRREKLAEDLFKNESSTLAHMAVLLSG